jgi:hypothetical protein
MENRKDCAMPADGDRITERLTAQAHILDKIASECWNEETADQIERFAHECDGAAAAAEP